MNDFQKGIDLTKQTAQITGDILKSMVKTFLENRSTKKGEVGISKLAESGKLESIEITNNNIGSFLSVAKKYDIDFALKRDKSVEPPVYHVFFATKNTDNFKRAFTEYAYGVQNKHKTYTVTREQMNENAKKISKQHDERSQDKERTRTKNQNIGGR